MFKNSRFTVKKFIGKSYELCIDYGFSKTPFGKIVLGAIQESDGTTSVCHLNFANELKVYDYQHIQFRWPKAYLRENQTLIEQLTEQIFSEDAENLERTVQVMLKGTDFQLAVWGALLKIPCGKAVTYSDVAEMIGKPAAVRSVSNAIASNDVIMLIPCHRVVNKTGNKLKYSGGIERKRQLLHYEGVDI